MTDPEVRAPPVDTNGWTQKEILRHMWGELRETNEKLETHIRYSVTDREKLNQVEKRIDRQWVFIIGIPTIIAAILAITQFFA